LDQKIEYGGEIPEREKGENTGQRSGRESEFDSKGEPVDFLNRRAGPKRREIGQKGGERREEISSKGGAGGSPANLEEGR